MKMDFILRLVQHGLSIFFPSKLSAELRVCDKSLFCTLHHNVFGILALEIESEKLLYFLDMFTVLCANQREADYFCSVL